MFTPVVRQDGTDIAVGVVGGHVHDGGKSARKLRVALAAGRCQEVRTTATVARTPRHNVFIPGHITAAAIDPNRRHFQPHMCI